MPLDPERMTPEKQSKMTQKDIEEYEKEMLSKNMAQQIWMQVPAGWRFVQGLKVVWEKTCEVRDWHFFCACCFGISRTGMNSNGT